MIQTTFSYTRTSGGVLAEHYDGRRWWMTYTEGDRETILPMYGAEKTYTPE